MRAKLPPLIFFFFFLLDNALLIMTSFGILNPISEPMLRWDHKLIEDLKGT